MGDLLDKKVTFSIKTIAFVLVPLVAASTFGYFRLDAKADIGVRAAGAVADMHCDVRQLKNFMIYGVKPSPLDRCDKETLE